ncbi:MAG: peptigoglycan-binding protein LysM [Gammaproteobacteria bacterium]|nr:MAG: peptigoglycan-binding protein LysM [Gammaproteobacteria bacterium]
MIVRRRWLALIFFILPCVGIAEVYDLPPAGDDVVGAITVIQARADDTLIEIARRHGLGYEDIVRANPHVDTWLPGEGTEVVLPTRYVLPPGERRGLILNLPEYRLYYFPEPKANGQATVMTFPISIGRMDWETPLGLTSVISKVSNPAWYPPASVRAEHAADGDPLPRIVPPGPNNPLGKYAMRLGLPGYLIHGTNRPAGVGMRVTHGCIRLFPEDIEFLFGQISVNTPVRIINEPIKIGWNGDELVVEVHQPLELTPLPASELAAAMPASEDSEAVAESIPPAPVVRDQLTALTEQFVAATNMRPGELYWEVAEQLLERADGVPALAGRRIKDAATSAASEKVPSSL